MDWYFFLIQLGWILIPLNGLENAFMVLPSQILFSIIQCFLYDYYKSLKTSISFQGLEIAFQTSTITSSDFLLPERPCTWSYDSSIMFQSTDILNKWAYKVVHLQRLLHHMKLWTVLLHVGQQTEEMLAACTRGVVIKTCHICKATPMLLYKGDNKSLIFKNKKGFQFKTEP